MSNRRRSLAVLLLSAFAGIATAQSNVAISQVYGGGGNTGAPLKNDYIELFNRGSATVVLTGMSVQYATAGGSSSWRATPLTGTLAPGRYYLVQEGDNVAGNGNPLPAPDKSDSIAMDLGSGQVALVNSTNPLSGNCPTGGVILDFVKYGGSSCTEGAAAPTLNNTKAAFRRGDGCNDSNNNSADFTIGDPAPRNSQTAARPCGSIDNPPSILPPANPIATVNQNAPPFPVKLKGIDDGNVFVWNASNGTGVTSVQIADNGTAEPTFTVTLQTSFTGTAEFTATLSDNANPTVSTTVNILVTADLPPTVNAPPNPIKTVMQDDPPFTVSLSGMDDKGVYVWSAGPGAGVQSVMPSSGQGTTTITYTVTLIPGFSGPATFTASLSDNVNPPAARVVNISVTPSGPRPLNHVVISQIYTGGGSTGAPWQNDFVQLYNPTSSQLDLGTWTLQYASATGDSWSKKPLVDKIGPHQYYLIALGSGGASGSPLPRANVRGSFNMSETSGKVALVRATTLLSGCPSIGSSNVVDLVGYGQATCHEGPTNAPMGNNTTAAFRKNGGATDTDVNGADFEIAAADPFRDAEIVERGPAVNSVIPQESTTRAPRDASISVTFSEAVDIAAGAFSVNCAVTGLHPENDATIARAEEGETWVLTPNAGFRPGEQCSVTLDRNFVTDTDADDSGANTNLLGASKSWHFTIATGDDPAYPLSVHLTMGNPSGATHDLNKANDYLMEKPAFALSYNRTRGIANWASWHLDDTWTGSMTRDDTFRPDPEVPPDWYRVQETDYSTTGFNRGHLAPNADRNNAQMRPVNQATYLMTNIIPQAPDNNSGPWLDLENDLRKLVLENDEIYIVAGATGEGGIGDTGAKTMNLAGGELTVPEKTWKVALVLPKAGGDDVARATAATRTIAVIMPNVQGIRSQDWRSYLVTVDDVEVLTGYDFFSKIADPIERAIETGVDGANPPAVDHQSVSTDEDAPHAFALNVFPSSDATLTYAITGPTLGALSGSGGTRTYTPPQNFNGTDSFTFSASDGVRTSATATATITVHEVNDPPAAVSDARTVAKNATLQLAASELAQNDAPGPSNESGQSLTVTAVAMTASTHGIATITGGVVRYTPAANFTGAASFTYTVCDNGTTHGIASPLCSSAQVNVTVRGFTKRRAARS